MFLSDSDILRRISAGVMQITPFVDHCVRQDADGAPVLSYGLGPAGYDVRLKPVWKVFRRSKISSLGFIDPKQFNDALLRVVEEDELFLQPGEYALAVTLERFVLPNDVQGTFFAKSTYARCGLMLNTTNVQPGWEGEVVMEFFNAAPLPLLLRANEGFAQIKFDVAESPSTLGYGVGGGVYQGQSGVQTPKV